MASIPSNGYAEVMAGTNNYSGSNSFDGSCPRTAIPPVIGNDLCNKTYVDGAGGGLIGTLTDKGSLITGDGTQAVIFDQNPYQTALTTTTVYDWNSLALGQSRQFTTTAPTTIPLGATITITYSGTDSIKGTVTAVAGTAVTITITLITSTPYSSAVLLTTTAPDTSTVAGSVFDGQSFPLSPATTTPPTAQIPAFSMITSGSCNVFQSGGGGGNFFFRLLGTGVQRRDSSTQALGTAIIGTANPTALTWSGTNGGCFYNSATAQIPLPLLVIIEPSPPLGAVFQFPIGGGFVPPNYAGFFSGYALSYGTGAITIDGDIALIADPASATGLAWGIVGGGGVGAVNSVSGGTNIIMSGSLSAPVVNLRNPLTAELNCGTQSLRDRVSSVGTSGQVLTCGTGGQVLWGAGAGGAVSSVTATPLANITIGGTASAPTVGVSTPCNATIDLGTQIITGSSGSLDFTLGDFTTIVQAGQVLNNNTAGAGSANLTPLQLDISDAAGDVLSTLNRDQLVIFNQTPNNDFTATLTKNSLTLADNAVPAVNTMLLTDNSITFNDVGNGAFANLNADAGLLLKPLPFTTSGLELNFNKLEMIRPDGAGSTSSRLINTSTSFSYDRMRFELPSGLFTDNQHECSLSQSINTTEYNDPVSTIQTQTRSDANAFEGRFKVLFNESTIPTANSSTLHVTPSTAELSQIISNNGGVNQTQITTSASAFAIHTVKDLEITSTNMIVDAAGKLQMTSSVASVSLPMLELVSTSVLAGIGLGTPTIKTQETKNAVTGDIIMSQQFFSKNFNGVDTQFGGIECRASTATAGDTDGSLDFYNTVNGNLIRTFTMNGNDNENNTFRALDLNGNSLKTSAANLTIDASPSTGNGVITLATKNGTGGLAISGDKTEAATAGGSAGNFLVITLNSVVYKIALLNV